MGERCYFFLHDSIETCDRSSKFPIYLYSDRDFIIDEHKIIILWPLCLVYRSGFSQHTPKLFGHMGCKWVEEGSKFFFPLESKFFIFWNSFIEKYHKARYRSIKFIIFDVFSYFFDGLMEELHGFHVIFGDIFRYRECPIDAIEKAPHSDDCLWIPRCCIRKPTHTHLIESESISTIFSYDIVRIDDIFEGFTHLCDDLFYLSSCSCLEEFPFFFFYTIHSDESSIRTLIGICEDHSHIGKLLKWFLRRHYTSIVEHLMPKSSIQKMKHGMLCPSYIFIDDSPVVHRLTTCECLAIFIIHIAEIIPAASSPLRHRIGLTFPREISGKFYIYPFWYGRKW